MIIKYGDFTFKEHINTLCRKASLKLYVLSRISQYLSQIKKRILFKTLTSQFSYCSLALMCHSRGLNNKINNIHKRALRIVYQDKKSHLQDLLQTEKSVSIHMKNLNIYIQKSIKWKMVSPPKQWRFFKSKIKTQTTDNWL